jgi:hypothetical protein
MPTLQDSRAFNINKNQIQVVSYPVGPNGKFVKIVNFGASVGEAISSAELEWGDGLSFEPIRAVHGVLDIVCDVELDGDGVKHLRVTLSNKSKASADMYYWIEYIVED